MQYVAVERDGKGAEAEWEMGVVVGNTRMLDL
jgi:hypothetical protein